LRRERNPFQKLTRERERERKVAPISLLHRREKKKNWTLEKRREGLRERELLGRGDKNKIYIYI
jgi:hypothetical protein